MSILGAGRAAAVVRLLKLTLFGRLVFRHVPRLLPLISDLVDTCLLCRSRALLDNCPTRGFLYSSNLGLELPLIFRPIVSLPMSVVLPDCKVLKCETSYPSGLLNERGLDRG